MTSKLAITYKLAIFDFDGTLADSFPWFARVMNGVADRYGFKRVEEHEVEWLRGLSAHEIVRHLGVPAWKLPFIVRHMRALSARDIGGVRLFGGVETMLRSLSGSGVALAVVSSNTEENVRRVLGPDLSRLIGQYACGASTFGKASKFRRVVKAIRAEPGDAICIGDEIRDLEAARRAGLVFGAVAWGFTTPEALRAREPERMFHSPADIVAALAPMPAAGARSLDQQVS